MMGQRCDWALGFGYSQERAGLWWVEAPTWYSAGQWQLSTRSDRSKHDLGRGGGTQSSSWPLLRWIRALTEGPGVGAEPWQLQSPVWQCAAASGSCRAGMGVAAGLTAEAAPSLRRRVSSGHSGWLRQLSSVLMKTVGVLESAGRKPLPRWDCWGLLPSFSPHLRGPSWCRAALDWARGKAGKCFLCSSRGPSFVLAPPGFSGFLTIV